MPDPEQSSAPQGDWTLFTDGGSRGNPGPAGGGVVLVDASGATRCAVGRFFGRATNNVAEYRALLAGLQEAIDLGVRRLMVRSDSELMVRQINGQYKVKNAGLRPLYEQALELVERFEQVEFVHIRREKNEHADALANRAMDGRRDVTDHDGEERLSAGGGGARGRGSVPSLPDDFEVVCETPGDGDCPCPAARGDVWRFLGRTPEGLCVHAAAAVLAGLTEAAGTGSMPISIACGRPECPARFSVRVL